MKKIIVLICVLATPVNSSDLTFDFNSPAFNGNGYSTHVLTVEQLEHQRKDKITADRQSALNQDERDYRNTNEYKFMNNLESRIYAQFSRQIADSLFGESGNTLADGNWAETETPFGDIIKWKREDDRIYVEICNSNGEVVSAFDVPVGEFAF